MRQKRLFTQCRESGVRLIITRSSHRRCSVKRGVLKNFEKFTGNTCLGVSFLTILQSFNPATFLKETPTQMFSCEVWEVFRTPILKNLCERLLLYHVFQLFWMWEHHFWRCVMNVRSLVKNNTENRETSLVKNNTKIERPMKNCRKITHKRIHFF